MALPLPLPLPLTLPLTLTLTLTLSLTLAPALTLRSPLTRRAVPRGDLARVCRAAERRTLPPRALAQQGARFHICRSTHALTPRAIAQLDARSNPDPNPSPDPKPNSDPNPNPPEPSPNKVHGASRGRDAWVPSPSALSPPQ
eukprot:scaffold15645_cov53-Phaeocystis_antarctica.AAC.3